MRLSRSVNLVGKLNNFEWTMTILEKKFRHSWAALVSIWLKNNILITIAILKIFFRHSWAPIVSIWLKYHILVTIVTLKIFFRHSWAPIVSIWLENWISRTFIVSRGARLLQKFNLKLPFFQLQMIPKSKCDQRSMLFYLFFIFCIWPSKQMTIQSSLSLWESSC